MFCVDVPFLLNLLRLQYCRGNLNLCQGNVREFRSVLSMGTLLIGEMGWGLCLEAEA